MPDPPSGPAMRRFRLAIFDFDGTLADSFPWFVGAMNQAADRFGFRRVDAAEVEALRGYESRQIIERLGLPMWKMPLVARELRRLMAADIDRIALFPGAERLLHRLAERGVELAIVTSNSEANVRRVLGPSTAALVRHYGCGASLFGKRPKLRQVLRASGTAAADAVSVGDEVRDLSASRAEGLPFVAVTWGASTPELLRAHAPEALVSSMEALADALAPAAADRRPAGSA